MRGPARSAMPPPFWIRNAKGRKAYLGFGNGISLGPNLVFLSGWRALAERVALTAARMPLMRSPVRDDKLLAGWKIVEDALAPSDAFLLYTDWYKETVFVGPVRKQDGALAFVKLFKDLADAEREVSNFRTAAKVAAGFFRVAKLQASENGLVAYELIEHGRTTPDAKRISQLVGAMCRSALEGVSDHRPLSGLLDWGRLAARIEAAGYQAALQPLATSDVLVPMVDGHGDCCPWNMFEDRAGQLCLVDYERAGPGAPFSDLYHLHTQPAVLAGQSLDARQLVALSADHGEAVSALWVAVYAAHQLELDFGLWEQGKRHHQLATLIKAKSALLLDAVGLCRAAL